MTFAPGDMAASLDVFDRVAVNLTRLERVWGELTGGVDLGPNEVPAPGAGTEAQWRVFCDIATSLPPIDGVRLSVDTSTTPSALNQRSVRAGIAEAMADYGHRLRGKRRELVRLRASELSAQVDSLLFTLTARHERSRESLDDDPEWSSLRSVFGELFQLLGKDELRGTRVTDLTRHLAFGLGVDLHDIADHDWPSVSPRIERALYNDDEPLPVPDIDLGSLVAGQPSGPLPTALNLHKLGGEDFERLVYALLTTTEGYENATWLMKTNAPDRGRDLSVERVSIDRLAGTARQRIIVQCKAWSKSLGPTDCANAIPALKLWEPPAIDVLVLATTGRFSADAVSWVEKHNAGDQRLKIEMWADSTIESHLAPRTDLVAEFDLRS